MPYWDDGSGQSKSQYDAGGGYDHHGNQNLNKNKNNNNPNPHRGPTPAEIAAAKAAAAAAAKAAANAKHKKWVTKTKKDRTKKFKHFKKLDDWIWRGDTKGKEFYKNVDLKKAWDMEKKWGYNPNYKGPGAIKIAKNPNIIDKGIGFGKYLSKAFNPKAGNISGGTPLMRTIAMQPFKVASRAVPVLGAAVTAYDLGKTYKDFVESELARKEKDPEAYAAEQEEQMGMSAAKGGVARKKYYKGSNGILDIDEESEDISLTAFNPKFDDVPELTEEKEEEKIDLFSETEEGDPLNNLLLAEDGVTTLFRAKNGGYAVQGGVKNYLGEQEMVSAPKHWQSAPDHPKTELTYITKPEKDLLVKADLHGSLHGSVNKGPQGITSLNGWGDADDGFGSSGDTSDGGWGNDPQGEFGGIDSGGWDPGVASDVGAVTSDAGWDNTSDSDNVPDSIGPSLHGGREFKLTPTQKTNEINRILERKQTWDKDKWKRDALTLISLPTTPLGIIPFVYNQNKKKNERIAQIDEDLARLEKLGYEPHPWEERGPGYGIKGDLEFEKFTLENPNWNKGPDDDKSDDEPEVPVAPVMEEIKDYTEMAWDPMSYLDKIRAGQAQRAALQAKGIIQDNEVMLNSGGLANLFTVKNYN